MLAPPAIVARALGHAFATDRYAVRGVDLSVAREEFVSIVGPSGCGKTTVLRMIAGLLRPTEGELRVATESGPRPRIAYVFQDPTLVPWRTALENVRLPADLAGRPRGQSTAEARAALRRTGLTDADAAKSPHMLSGGMRMRVSLARALVTRPEILLLDEPFAALDDLTRQRLNQDLAALSRDAGCTSVLVTHNIAEALFLSRRILVMGGRPGAVVAEFAVPFSEPRPPELRSRAEFAALSGEVSRALEAHAA